MIVTEFRLDHPAFRSALQAVPEMTITWQRSDGSPSDRVLVLFWATGGDFATFEDALERDPTAGDPRLVHTAGDRHLYQMELQGDGLERSVYPTIVEAGGVIHRLTASADGWEFHAAFPDRGAFDRVAAFCRENDLTLEFFAMYEEDDAFDRPGYALTARQRETLIAAIDCGYFEIPRECSLADLGDELDVSKTATSERLRRAMRTLVTNTVYPDRETE